MVTPYVAISDVKNNLPVPDAKKALGHDGHTVVVEQLQRRLAIALPHIHHAGAEMVRKHVSATKHFALALRRGNAHLTQLGQHQLQCLVAVTCIESRTPVSGAPGRQQEM
jgi:hypothetical protein